MWTMCENLKKTHLKFLSYAVHKHTNTNDYITAESGRNERSYHNSGKVEAPIVSNCHFLYDYYCLFFCPKNSICLDKRAYNGKIFNCIVNCNLCDINE